MELIRKISIGSEYKDNAMHYAVGQEVYGGHRISDIKRKETGYEIWITKDDEMKLWKFFNNNMAISHENNLEY